MVDATVRNCRYLQGIQRPEEQVVARPPVGFRDVDERNAAIDEASEDLTVARDVIIAPVLAGSLVSVRDVLPELSVETT